MQQMTFANIFIIEGETVDFGAAGRREGQDRRADS